ncbi:phospholipase D1/2 [Rhodoligotrophos appendicifer]|uniref:phospholipase D-like domain-containing protein n=1 Tax=Rhodoligotrophos appendicifer TaxID=987056 RepID=UPI0011853A5E|nr:phospholipase D-like domain-containing protein [Rhodoligotrophos appendicifer]
MPLLSPGRNCLRVETARRFAIIIDAADYFRAVKRTMLDARHCIYLIGWDFDTRIKFEPAGASLEGPNTLGSFLKWIGKTRPHLSVRILKWDLGALKSLGRGTMPFHLLNFMTSPNVNFKLDGAHPPGAAHHQKLVVIDDSVAFCGGIDITGLRWDTRKHLDDDPCRIKPDGHSYGPWHDATTAIEGPAARALGELARERWHRATGDKLLPPEPWDGLWPSDLKPSLTHVDVAIARTLGADGEQQEVREIETLYLDAIASAKTAIYCESQYFASRRVSEAIIKRLSEEQGPEIVVINPLSADGFLESAVMDTARARLLSLVQRSDPYRRFRIYTPVSERGSPIYVHAKIMIIDDWLLRVGSSNLNNRSMGLDSECDLAIEAVEGAPNESEVRAMIRDLRDDLLSEHLGIALNQLQTRSDRSLIAVIEELRGEGKTLVPYVPDEPNAVEEALSESDLLDPERPPSLWRSLIRGVLPSRHLR